MVSVNSSGEELSKKHLPGKIKYEKSVQIINPHIVVVTGVGKCGQLGIVGADPDIDFPAFDQRTGIFFSTLCGCLSCCLCCGRLSCLGGLCSSSNHVIARKPEGLTWQSYGSTDKICSTNQRVVREADPYEAKKQRIPLQAVRFWPSLPQR